MTSESKVWFAELTMREVEEAAKTNKLIILPIGSVEEHGTYMPLCTDSLQPEHVALEAAKKTDSLIAPPLKYGVCNISRIFPGTISISFHSLCRITREIVEEFIRNGFRRFLILSGHAEDVHMVALKLAAHQVLWKHTEETKKNKLRITVCSDYDFAYELRGKQFDKKDGHGGTIEASRVLAIRPDLTKGKRKKSFQKIPRFEIISDLREYLPEGIRGDQTVASAEKGRFINDYIIKQTVKLIEELKR